MYSLVNLRTVRIILPYISFTVYLTLHQLGFPQDQICSKIAAHSGSNEQISRVAPPILVAGPNCISLDCCLDCRSCRNHQSEVRSSLDSGSCRNHQSEVRSTQRAGIYYQFRIDSISDEKYSECQGFEGRGIVLDQGNGFRHL